jgi:hypothetical protein
MAGEGSTKGLSEPRGSPAPGDLGRKVADERVEESILGAAQQELGSEIIT